MICKIGDVLEGTVIRVYPRYAILLFDEGETGLLHISEISKHYVSDLGALLPVGTIYKVKVIGIDDENKSMRVSAKRLTEGEKKRYFRKKKIEAKSIDFSLLKENLPKWIEEENNDVK